MTAKKADSYSPETYVIDLAELPPNYFGNAGRGRVIGDSEIGFRIPDKLLRRLYPCDIVFRDYSGPCKGTCTPPSYLFRSR